MSFSFLRVAAIVMFVSAAQIRAADLPIIARARAYLGTEAALDGINVIHYRGTVVSTDSSDPLKPRRENIEIVVEKPDRERVTARSAERIESTGLDGYEAWQRVTDAKDPSKWNQVLLAPEVVKKLRAQTWENIGFYRGLERRGGVLRDEGLTTVDGVACRKVAFVHAPDIIFYHYFAAATGKAVLVETSGVSIRFQGEMLVNGVRFAQTLTQVNDLGHGRSRTIVTTFDTITVNDSIPDSYFSVPLLTAQ